MSKSVSQDFFIYRYRQIYQHYYKKIIKSLKETKIGFTHNPMDVTESNYFEKYFKHFQTENESAKIHC